LREVQAYGKTGKKGGIEIMKKISFSAKNSRSFTGAIINLVRTQKSMTFSSNGVVGAGSKFGRVRKATSRDAHILTTREVEVSLTEKGLRIFSPLNKGFGYGDIIIPFGIVTFAYNSFFWRDDFGFWRQMRFSKIPGWALKTSNGRREPVS